MVSNEMSGHAGVVVQAGSVGVVNFAVSPPPPRVPRQAPPPSRIFTDREPILAALAEVAGSGPLDGPRVAVVRGLAGIGKSAVLRQAAARLANRFPDGVLHVDLARKRHRGAAAVGEAAGDLCVALGDVEQWLPAEFSRRVDRWRALSAGQRLLVILDGVSEDAQVSALLPNSPDSMVLAASNRALYGVLRDGAVDVELAVLDAADAVRLLARACRDGRVDADPEAAAALAELCGHLPLALCVAGGLLATTPGLSVSGLLDRMAGTVGLDDLAEGGDAVVEAMFDLVYDELPERAARVYRTVGLLGGPHFEADVVAAMCGLDVADTARQLDVLRGFSLLESTVDGRCSLHRLVRLHALRRSERVDGDEERTGALHRAVRWWLLGAAAADVAATGTRKLRIAVHPELSPEDVTRVPPKAALDWLDREHANLLGLMRASAERGWHDEVWQIFESLFALYDHRKPLAAWVEAGTLAVRSAVASGRADAEARCRCLLARAYLEREEFDRAHAELALARRRAADDGGERLIASTLDFTGTAYQRQGDDRAALDCFERALAINERLRQKRGTALMAQLAGRSLGRLGEVERALAALRRSSAIADEIGEDAVLAKARRNTAQVLADAGRTVEARAEAERALAVAKRDGLTAIEADVSLLLGALAAEAGDSEEAGRLRGEALKAYERMGSPRAARVQFELDIRRSA